MNFLSNLFGGGAGVGFSLDASTRSAADQKLSTGFGGTNVTIGGPNNWQPWAIAGLAAVAVYLIARK